MRRPRSYFARGGGRSDVGILDTSNRAWTADRRQQYRLRRFQARRADIECFAPIRAQRGCQSELTLGRCQSRLTGVEQKELAAALESDDPAVALRAVGALHRLAEQIEARGVRLARERGWSWEQIGDALGVSRQSVHAKYGKQEQ